MAGLYDFLYRDIGRITSYYAQLFSGRLTQLEETDSDRRVKDQSAKLNVQIASGDVKTSIETQVSAKRVIDPHDVITTDVLSYLVQAGHANLDVANAVHGTVVLTKGTLAFFDKYMLEIAFAAIETNFKFSPKPKTPEEKAIVQGYNLLKTAFSKLSLPSAFLLQTEDGLQIAGTIKDAGLEEPISSYYFKYGQAGLADVFLIGIKEIPSTSLQLSGAQLLGASQQAAQALADFLLPSEALRVTPIAMFRKL